MYKIPISGGPHTGKTTLLNALHDAFPEAYFVPEPAERLITAEQQKAQADPTYTGIFPWNRYPDFLPRVLDVSKQLEAAIPPDSGIVFQDRSVIDNLGYATLNGVTGVDRIIKRQISAARYAFAFFCEPVGVYKPTEVRRESIEQARLTHQHLAAAYTDSGIRVVHLPAVSTLERVDLVRQTIDTFFEAKAARDPRIASLSRAQHSVEVFAQTTQSGEATTTLMETLAMQREARDY